MNGVRYGNLFLGAYESQPKSTVKEAYTSDIPEPPKVTIVNPTYPVYTVGTLYTSNPSTLTVAGDGTVWTYTIANNSIKSIAGSGTDRGTLLNVDGQGMNARFGGIGFFQVLEDGTIYLTSRIHGVVRRVRPDGYVERFFGKEDVNAYYVPGTPLASATLFYPTALYLDRSTNTLYITNTSQIVKVNLLTNAISSLSLSAGFNFSLGQIGLDSQKNVIGADVDRHIVFKVSPSGVCTVIAGQSGTSGYVDDTTPTNARFNQPTAVVVDSQDNIIVYDSGNLRFRKITPAGVVTTLAGNGTNGRTDGTGTGASFDIPTSHYLQLQIDQSDTIWIPFGFIRKLTSAGVVTTVFRY